MTKEIEGTFPHLMQPDQLNNGAPCERVLALISRRLRDGHLVPGQSIIARDLAAELGVSLAPVREALHILAGRGVIELLPQRSPRIRKLSGHDIIDILRVWAGLGTVAIKASAKAFAEGTATADDRVDIEEAVQRMRSAERRGNPMDSLASVLAFHDVLDRISGNNYLQIIKGQLHFAHLHRNMAERWPWTEQGLMSRNMSKIAKYVLAGNPGSAERAYIAHQTHSIGELERKLGSPETPRQIVA